MNCDGCDLPPLPGQKLKSCSRCKSVWYHNVDCQREHFKAGGHSKAKCRLLAASDAFEKKASGNVRSSSAPSTQVECRVHNTKGRYIVATSPMNTGCHPLSSSSPDVNGDGLCRPLCPPVLMETERRAQCSYCFQPLDRSHTANSLHNHCSSQCRARDTNCSLEDAAVSSIHDVPSPTVVLCSRILRYCEESPDVAKKFTELCFNVEDLSQEEKEEYLSIMIRCSELLRLMNSKESEAAYDTCRSMIQLDPTLAFQFMSRLIMNGFTISTSEQLPLGVGVYPAASMINHSCRPNAVPTFWFSTPSPPMLQITMCKSVRVGDEIAISYCDVSAPRYVRREGLIKNYKFACDCSHCGDFETDGDMIGLKCQAIGCIGKAMPLAAGAPAKEGQRKLDKLQLQCNVCGSDEFDTLTTRISDYLLDIERIESALKRGNYFASDISSNQNYGSKLATIYKDTRTFCHSKSWFVAWSADAFVNWCANSLALYDNEQEQLSLCSRALEVISEIKTATEFCMRYPGSTRWHMRRGIEAKLRLFMNPGDTEAIEVLLDVKNTLSLYYPPDDALMCSLKESIQSCCS